MATSKINYVPHCVNLGALPTNTNLDNVKSWSISRLTSNNTYLGTPTDVRWGMLETIPSGTLIVQRLSAGTLYYRYYGNNEWSAWQKYTTT